MCLKQKVTHSSLEARVYPGGTTGVVKLQEHYPSHLQQKGAYPVASFHVPCSVASQVVCSLIPCLVARRVLVFG